MATDKKSATLDERKRVDRERKRRTRKDMRAQGLKPYEVWVRTEEWPKVKRYIQNLARKRPPISGQRPGTED